MSWMAGERKRDVREPELSEFFSDGRAVNAGQHDFTHASACPWRTPPTPLTFPSSGLQPLGATLGGIDSHGDAEQTVLHSTTIIYPAAVYGSEALARDFVCGRLSKVSSSDSEALFEQAR